MLMSPPLRKFMLTIHLTASVGWIGTVIAYLVLVVAAMNSQDNQLIRAAWVAMELMGWYMIVPSALAALLTGLIMSLGTSWGLFRHYWILLSLVLTALATIVLIQHMQTVSFFTELAVSGDSTVRSGLSGELFHAGIGLLVLIIVQMLNVYKPRGLTPYGWRKQQERRMVSHS